MKEMLTIKRSAYWYTKYLIEVNQSTREYSILWQKKTLYIQAKYEQ